MVSAPFATVERTVLMRVGQQLRPELFVRVTEKIVFARLGYPTQREICEQLIADEGERLRGLGNAIEVGPDAVEFLIREGYHKTLGARPMPAVDRAAHEFQKYFKQMSGIELPIKDDAVKTTNERGTISFAATSQPDSRTSLCPTLRLRSSRPTAPKMRVPTGSF